MKKYSLYFLGLWFLFVYSFGAVLLIFPGEFIVFKWIFSGFLLFYFFILIATNGWKMPWKLKEIRSKITHVINVFLFFSLASLVAYFSYQNPINWDLTGQKINKVSGSTKKILGLIEHEMKITVLAEKKYWQRIDDFFQFFSAEQPHIQVKMFSPDKHPEFLASLGINKLPAYIYEYQSQKRVGYHLNEIELIKKTKSLVGFKTKTICWLNGFAGVNLNEEGRNGASYLKGIIAQEGHNIIETEKPLSLCDSYISLGYNSASKEDLIQFKEFIGSKPILLAIDPDLKQVRPPEFWSLLEESGVKINNHVVIDRQSLQSTGQAVNLSFDPQLIQHNIFNGLTNPLMLPLSTSFEVLNEAHAILSTPNFPHSWSETDLKSLVATGDVNYSTQDIQGPIPVLVETLINDNKLFIFGTSLFVTNAYKSYSENFHFFLNIISNLLGDDISVGSRPQIQAEVLQFNQSQLNLVTYLCLIVTPLSFLLIAFYCYRQQVRK